MTKFAFLAMLAGAVILLSGCAARELIVSEVLRVPEQATIRTAYNLWYTNPMEMDTINHQQGTIIPFGTEVQITEATEEEIFFKTVEDALRWGAGAMYMKELEEGVAWLVSEGYMKEHKRPARFGYKWTFSITDKGWKIAHLYR